MEGILDVGARVVLSKGTGKRKVKVSLNIDRLWEIGAVWEYLVVA